MNSRLTLLALALLVLLPGLRAQEKVSLLPHWDPGKLYRYDVTIDTAVTGAAATQSNSIILQIDILVRQEAADGAVHAEVKATALKVMLERNGVIKTFDSDNPDADDPRLKDSLKNFLGQPLTLVYDNKDAFVKVILPEGSTLGTPDGRTGPTGECIAEFFREALTGALPAAPVQLKEEFTRENRVQLTPEVTAFLKQKGHVESLTPSQATVLAEGVIEALPSDPSNVPPGGTPKINVKAETLFDLEKRAVHRVTTTLDVKPPGERNRDSSVTITTIATLKSLEPAPAEKK